MKLIINGDDFGITHACNLAIIDCYQKGMMRSTSLMVNMPYVKEAVALWKENPNLSVGLHLNLTVGFPLTKQLKTLVKADGSFNKNILHASRNEIDKEEVIQECKAQMDAFIALMGTKPDHINSHHGIEAIPYGADVLQSLALQYDLPIRELTHVSNPETFNYQTNYIVPKKMFCKEKFQTPEAFIQLFTKQDIESDRYYEWLGHPGYVDWDLLQLSSLTDGRCYDAHCFTSPIIQQWVQNNHIEIITYKDLPKTIK